VPADGRNIEFLFGKRETTPQSRQAVLKVREVLSRHQINDGEFLKVLEPLVTRELSLALILVYTQPGLGVHPQIGYHVSLFEIGKFALCLLAERGAPALGRVSYFAENIVTHFLHLLQPLVTIGEHGLDR